MVSFPGERPITKEHASAVGASAADDVTVVTYVHCAYCIKYFRSTLQFGTLREFERAARVGLIAQCPDCYRIFDCNRNNMYCDVTGSGRPESFPAPPPRKPPFTGSAADQD